MLNVASMIGIDASKTELVVALAPQNVVRKDGEPPADLVASGVGRKPRISWCVLRFRPLHAGFANSV